MISFLAFLTEGRVGDLRAQLVPLLAARRAKPSAKLDKQIADIRREINIARSSHAISDPKRREIAHIMNVARHQRYTDARDKEAWDERWKTRGKVTGAKRKVSSATNADNRYVDIEKEFGDVPGLTASVKAFREKVTADKKAAEAAHAKAVAAHTAAEDRSQKRSERNIEVAHRLSDLSRDHQIRAVRAGKPVIPRRVKSKSHLGHIYDRLFRFVVSDVRAMTYNPQTGKFDAPDTEVRTYARNRLAKQKLSTERD